MNNTFDPKNCRYSSAYRSDNGKQKWNAILIDGSDWDVTADSKEEAISKSKSKDGKLVGQYQEKRSKVEARKINAANSFDDRDLAELRKWAERQVERIEFSLDNVMGDDDSLETIKKMAEDVRQRLIREKKNYSKPLQRQIIDEMIKWFEE